MMRTLTALLVVGLAFQTNYQYIVNHFCQHGAFLLDSGLFSHLVYQNPSLQQAPVIGDSSYISTHFTPWLQGLSAASYLIALPPPFYYAFTQGLTYAIVAGSGLLALSTLFKKELRPWGLLPLSLLYAFNGIVLASVGYPHFEPIYAGWAVLFLLALQKGQNTLTWVYFLLTLIVREDTGFHLFGFTFLLFLVSWKEAEFKPQRKQLAIFSVLALCYPLLVMSVQKNYFPGDSALVRVYLGDPLYSHLNAAFMQQRMQILWQASSHVLVPWLLLIAGAVYLRSWSFLVGFVAVLPWLALNVLAVADTAGSLFSYYSFPLIVSLLWPAIWYGQKTRTGRVRTAVLVIQSLVLLSSAALHSRGEARVLEQMFTRPTVTMEQYRQLEGFVDGRLGDGRTSFDAPLASLFTQKLSREDVIRGDRDNSQAKALLCYFNGYDSESVHGTGLENHLDYSYRFRHFPVFLLSDQEEDLGEMWVANPPGSLSFERAILPLETVSVARLSLAGNSKRDPRDQSIISEAFSEHPLLLAFGPYQRLRRGSYVATFELQSKVRTDKGWVLCEVVTDVGKRTLVNKRLDSGELSRREGQLTVELAFQVDPDSEGQSFEFRIWKQGDISVTLSQLHLKENDSP